MLIRGNVAVGENIGSLWRRKFLKRSWPLLRGHDLLRNFLLQRWPFDLLWYASLILNNRLPTWDSNAQILWRSLWLAVTTSLIFMNLNNRLHTWDLNPPKIMAKSLIGCHKLINIHFPPPKFLTNLLRQSFWGEQKIWWRSLILR